MIKIMAPMLLFLRLLRKLMKLLMLDMVKMNGVREVLMRSENILVMLMVQDLDIGFPVMNVMSL